MRREILDEPVIFGICQYASVPLVVVSISLIYDFTYLFLSIFAFTHTKKPFLVFPRILSMHPSNRKYSVQPLHHKLQNASRSHSF